MIDSPASPAAIQSPFDRFLATKRFGSLDGLRALSILAVLWHHSGIHIPGGPSILDRGQLGVQLFFAISGFLITTLMIREKARHGTISLAKFFARRALRIFPLYYAVLAVYTLLVWKIERGTQVGREFFQNLPAFATYTTNWFVHLKADEGSRVIFYYSWSLAVEEQFYLTWPWAEKHLRTGVKVAILALVLGVVVAHQFGAFAQLIAEDSLLHRVIWYIAPCILLGVMAAHALHQRGVFDAVFRVLGRAWSAPAALACVLAAAALPESVASNLAAYFALVALTVACTIREDHALARPLSFAPLARLGVISYGVYLMHMLCFNVARKALDKAGLENKWLAWFAGIALVWIVAEVSFRTFERFFQERKLKYAR